MKSLIKYLLWMITAVICLTAFWIGIVWILFGVLWQKVLGGLAFVAFFGLLITICAHQDEKEKSKGYSPKHMARRERK